MPLWGEPILKYTFILISLLFGCSGNLVKKDIQKIQAPYEDGRFKNLEPMPLKSFWQVMKWRWSRMWSSSKWPESVESNQYRPTSERVTEDVRIAIINHATVLIQMNGLNILTDPIYSERTSPVSFMGPKRVVRPGIRFEDLPPIDLVVISHNHYDHLDLPTLKKLDEKHSPLFLVGLGNGRLLDCEGIKNFKEFDWWDSVNLKGVEVIYTPSQHWSARGFFDRNKTLWGGFVFKGKKTIYFAGDTGYGKFFKLIKERLGELEIALLPIGAYEPRWFMRAHHVNPEDSVRAFKDIGSKYALGVHFGTFANLTDEPIDQPGKDLAKALKKYGVDPKYFLVPEFGKEYKY